MLNKLKFNNLVISNKNGIQQSRIQTINKLVQKIRKLKTLLEKRPDDDKCKERIRKSTESMELLKKFKRVEMMKHVLLLEKLPAAVITNGLSTPDEIAVALLAMNKVMQLLIKRFKTELHLNEAADAKWREELKENSKRRQKIERTEQKKLKRTTLKEQKAKEHKRKEWLEQNLENANNRGEEVADVETEVSTVGIWKVEEVEVANKTEEKEVVKSKCADVQPLKRVREKKIKNHKEKIVDNSNKVIEKIPKVNKVQEENRTEPVSDQIPNKKPKIKAQKSQKITKFHDNETSEEEIPTDNQDIDLESDGDESASETHVVDPFFVTDTGENYLSTAVINRNNTEHGHNDEHTQKDLQMVKLSGSKKHINYRDRKQEQGDRRSTNSSNERGPWKHNNNDRRQPQTKNKWTNNSDSKPWQKGNDSGNRQASHNNWANTEGAPPRKQNQERFSNNAKVKANHTSSNTKTEEKLHPSWAAKQRQKPIITGFQGKKITFGDDGITKDTSNNTSSRNNAKFTRKDTPAPVNLKADSLHPSWVAKQKQKPTITAFQGKKITFDNDD